MLPDLSLRSASPSDSSCDCVTSFDRPVGTGVDDRVVLSVDATTCAGRGDLAVSPACLATVVEALAERDADIVRTRCAGVERTYAGRATACLVAAGRFHEQIAFHETRLADRVQRDPVGAAREAAGRAGPASRIVAETGLEVAVGDATETAAVIRAHVGPTVASTRIAADPPPSAALVDRWELETGAVVRQYEARSDTLPTYHLTPPWAAFGDDDLAVLAAAAERLLADPVGGNRAPGRAVRAVADESDPVPELVEVLRRHTRGYGAFEHVFADERVSDATVSAPVTANPLRVVLDGERCRTNVRLPPAGAATLASRLRRTSGRAFSRATPVLDASIDAESGTVRVAATTAPVSDGLSFTFRRGTPEAWTLGRLVGSGTLTPEAAGLLAVAVERGVAGLVAGGRGAGKTTTLGALLWELPASTRAILIEDTPELPADALTTAGRDVQRLSVGDSTGPGAGEAVRTALRLGSGALVVGEVRGREATALYEAMRVGAASETVLGTIHGESPRAVEERVVTDLGVPPSSFAATDLLVVIDAHRVESITEVTGHGDEIGFDPLFERGAEGLVPTGRVDRGESRLVASLARTTESYADVREHIAQRVDGFTTDVESRSIETTRSEADR